MSPSFQWNPILKPSGSEFELGLEINGLDVANLTVRKQKRAENGPDMFYR